MFIPSESRCSDIRDKFFDYAGMVKKRRYERAYSGAGGMGLVGLFLQRL